MKSTVLVATALIFAMEVSAAPVQTLSGVATLNSSRPGERMGGGDNCCTEHLEPGCTNPDIEACVCAIDNFCCTDVWDDLCVTFVEAGDCGTCGGLPCCEPQGVPGCAQDPVVQDCVCAQDSYCCDTEWDAVCVEEIEKFGCGTCGGPPPHDACANAVVVNIDVTLPIDTSEATTDGPALPAACDDDGGLSFDNDLWYCYSPDCSGDITVSLCGDSFDNRLAVYEGCDCPATNDRLVACSDNFCGFQALTTFNASGSLSYLIRVGGNGATGLGQLEIIGGETDNKFDCNGNTVFDGCDVSSGDSGDCNENGTPDECELDDGHVLIQQLPNQSNGLFSDPDCASCTSGSQSVAEQFRIFDTTVIERIRIWGGYFPTNNPPISDNFTVIFQRSSAGLPLASFHDEPGIASTRRRTGVQMFGVDEWEYELTLERPLSVDPGIYYIEIFNDTTGNDDSFFWGVGDNDAVAGANGNAVDPNAAPGVEWFASGDDQSLQLLGPPLIDCDGNGVPDVCKAEPVEAPGDLNADCIVDIDDYALLLDCVTGPNNGPISLGCEPVDFDNDDDVDLGDVGEFSMVFGLP